MRGILIALAILAVPVTWLILEEREARALADLSVIGSGEPVAVQVFDRGCPDCRRLRDNAEQALSNIEHAPAWRIVDINTSQGRRSPVRNWSTTSPSCCSTDMGSEPR
ncbi:hypothetical protein Q427_11855 [Halomonas sp. BC04]|nr:hypothetical protein Q427_11855 [Halomonas sp. BC04]